MSVGMASAGKLESGGKTLANVRMGELVIAGAATGANSSILL
jgi:hypothetical protein